MIIIKLAKLKKTTGKEALIIDQRNTCFPEGAMTKEMAYKKEKENDGA